MKPLTFVKKKVKRYVYSSGKGVVSKEPTRITLPADSGMWSEEFLFGTATAAFQIEGDAEHRQPNIWDRFCEQPGNIADGSNGLVACDHINHLSEDLELLDSLNVDAYRFSISWGRVLREDGSVNQQGVDFYKRLVEGLRDRDIKPWVTLYHWDLPSCLDDKGGWLNRDTAYRFQEYVDHVSRALTGGVDAWMTINEPMVSSYLGYVLGIHAPGAKDPANYGTVAHHLLLAHGLGLRVLRENDPSTASGIALNISHVDSATDKEHDRHAARQADLTFYRRFLDPLLTGQYNENLARLPGETLPHVEADDMKLIGQRMDFLGINYYTRAIYRAAEGGGFEEIPPTGDLTDMGWEVYPSGLTELLVTLNQDYDLPPVFITENGAAFPDQLDNGVVMDERRIQYIQEHLLAIDEAIRKGVDVQGLFYWSFMDNFEWAEGYRKRFGIVHVDYANQERTVKASGLMYRDLLHSRASKMIKRQANASI